MINDSGCRSTPGESAESKSISESESVESDSNQSNGFLETKSIQYWSQ